MKFSKGEKVLAKDGYGDEYSGVVLDKKHGKYWIKFDGWDSTFNEWVSFSKIRSLQNYSKDKKLYFELQEDEMVKLRSDLRISFIP